MFLQSSAYASPPATKTPPRAMDGQHQVGLVPVVGDDLRKLTDSAAERLVGQVLAYAAHARPYTGVRWKFWNDREAVGPR